MFGDPGNRRSNTDGDDDKPLPWEDESDHSDDSNIDEDTQPQPRPRAKSIADLSADAKFAERMKEFQKNRKRSSANPRAFMPDPVAIPRHFRLVNQVPMPVRKIKKPIRRNGHPPLPTGCYISDQSSSTSEDVFRPFGYYSATERSFTVPPGQEEFRGMGLSAIYDRHQSARERRLIADRPRFTPDQVLAALQAVPAENYNHLNGDVVNQGGEKVEVPDLALDDDVFAGIGECLKAALEIREKKKEENKEYEEDKEEVTAEMKETKNKKTEKKMMVMWRENNNDDDSDATIVEDSEQDFDVHN